MTALVVRRCRPTPALRYAATVLHAARPFTTMRFPFLLASPIRTSGRLEGGINPQGA